MTMMDSMTNKELDSADIKTWQSESRVMRIARGAGVHPKYVGELIGRHTPHLNVVHCLVAGFQNLLLNIGLRMEDTESRDLPLAYHTTLCSPSIVVCSSAAHVCCLAVFCRCHSQLHALLIARACSELQAESWPVDLTVTCYGELMLSICGCVQGST